MSKLAAKPSSKSKGKGKATAKEAMKSRVVFDSLLTAVDAVDGPTSQQSALQTRPDLEALLAAVDALPEPLPQRSALQMAQRDKELMQEAPQRRKVTIDPESPDFDNRVNYFRGFMQQHTVRHTLEEHFTPHERDLLMPPGTNASEALLKVQRLNQSQYSKLMNTPRFAKWKDSGGRIEVKLAMMWFGLPAAPINYQLGVIQNESQDDESLGDLNGFDTGEDHIQLTEQLKFLDQYGARYFGNDTLREEDEALSMYHELNKLISVRRHGAASIGVGLRGGLAKYDEQVEPSEDGSVEGDDDFDLDFDGDDLYLDETPTPAERSQRKEGDNTWTPEKGVRFADSQDQTPSPSAVVEELEELEEDDTHMDMHYQQAQHQYDSYEPAMREKAYANIVSVHTEGKIPINAAPVEKVVRFGASSLPALTLGVMTPTEQRRLQVAYYEMRNINLDRSQQCPYLGCGRVFAMVDDDKLQRHLEEVHVGDQCNFCDEVLYKHMTENQRRAHFLGEHMDLFLTDKDWKADNAFKIPSQFRVDWARESRYKFCPRCGRNHGKLNAHADRTQHDNICFPGSSAGPHDWTACARCGGEKRAGDREAHVCQTVINEEEIPFCDKCALPAGLFSDLYRGKHLMHCRGHSNEVSRFCPWCAQNLGDTSNTHVAFGHMSTCSKRPDDLAEGPLDPHTGKPWPFAAKYDPPAGPGLPKDPPTHCPECKEAVYHLDAHLLMQHVEDKHEDKLTYCLFCKLDFGRRGWANDRHARVQHLDDHIHERRQTLANELVRTRVWPKNHPYTKRKVDEKDFEKLKWEQEIRFHEEQNAALAQWNEKLKEELNGDKVKLQELNRQLEEVALAAKLAAAKSAAPKRATPKPATEKPATPEPATPEPATPKPATPKSTISKPEGKEAKGKEKETTPVPQPATKEVHASQPKTQNGLVETKPLTMLPPF